MAEDLREARRVWTDEVEVTMLAARALVSISAQSVVAVEDVVTPPQHTQSPAQEDGHAPSRTAG